MPHFDTTDRDRYFNAAQEDRSAPRTRMELPATLRISGARGVSTTVYDLSLSGFSVAAVSRLTPGTVCWLTLPGMEAMQAEVVWWNNSVAGCAFSRMLSPVIHQHIMTGAEAAGQIRPT